MHALKGFHLQHKWDENIYKLQTTWKILYGHQGCI